MKYGTYFQRQMKDPEFLRVFAQERLILDIQEEICRFMQENGISRNELAKRMGKSKGFITQILNSGRNLTLRTVADVFTALEAQISVRTKRKEEETTEPVIHLSKYIRYETQTDPRYIYNYQQTPVGYGAGNEVTARF